MSGLAKALAFVSNKRAGDPYWGNSRVWVAGDNTKGKLGPYQTDAITPKTPFQFLTSSYYYNDVYQMAIGTGHSLVLQNDRMGYAAYGYNSNRDEWGFGIYMSDTNVPSGYSINNVGAAPCYLPVGPTNKIAQMAAGSSFSLMLLDDGTIYGAGYNQYGQLGFTANTTANSFTYTKPVLAGQCKQIDCNYSNGMALLKNGTVKVWGMNIFGSTQNTEGPYAAPIPELIPNLTDVKQICVTQSNTTARSLLAFFLKTDGTVWKWGYNGAHTQVEGLTNVRKIAISTYQNNTTKYHGLALLYDGSVKSWGNNEAGQLGRNYDESIASYPTPALVPGMVDVTQIIAIPGGSAFLRKDNTIWTVGVNDYGQLGRSVAVYGQLNLVLMKAQYSPALLTGLYPVKFYDTMSADPVLHLCKHVANNTLHYYEDAQWKEVATNPASQIDFIAHGMDVLPTPARLIELVGGSGTVEIQTQQSSIAWGTTLNVTGVPYDQVVFATGDIDISVATNIDWFRMENGGTTATTSLRYIASRDSGVSWWAYNGSTWVQVGLGNPSAAQVMTSGMSKAVFDAAPWQDWTIAANYKQIRFGYAFSLAQSSDTAINYYVQYQYDGPDAWKVATLGTDYEVHFISNTQMEVKFLTGGYNAKVNY